MQILNLSSLVLNSIELLCYPFMVSVDRINGSCNTHDVLSKICVSNKTEDVNLNIFNMIARINESKAKNSKICFMQLYILI